MSIAVIQVENKQFSVRPAEQLTLQVADFLKQNPNCEVTDISADKIDGKLTTDSITVRELAIQLSSHLDYKIESDSEGRSDWTLYSKEEADYYEHYGV